ncbi:MAG: hypothetical protein AB1700_07850 [Bacillota bacterium]
MTAMLKLREKAGISAKELSLRTGIPVEVIIRAELGLIKLRPQQRKRIVRALR